MDTPKSAPKSSYQLLVEQSCDFGSKNPDDEEMNVTELLRDLYIQLYKVKNKILKYDAIIASLEAKQDQD